MKKIPINLLFLLFAVHQLSAQEIEQRIDPMPSAFKNRISLTHDLDLYSEHYDTRNFTALEYLRKTKYGSLIGRINRMNRADNTGFQYDLDAYPKFGKRSYAYLNFAYSDAEIFPKYRFGAEFFKVFKNNVEASLGYRHIDVASGANISILTGTIGLYTGNYWVSLRGYFIPKDDELSNSYNLSCRRYFKDSENYLSANLGYGSSYDENRFGGNYNASYNIGLGYQLTLGNKIILATRAEYRREELSFSPGDYVNHYVLSCGVKYRF